MVPVATLGNIFSSSLSLTDVNNNPTRNQLIGNIAVKVASGQRELANDHSSRFIIDVARTVNNAPGNHTCHICRTVPGSVCCNDELQMAYLEIGTGRLIDFNYDATTSTFSLSVDPAAPDPLAVSVKNLPAANGYHHLGTFCIPGIETGSPVPYVVDAATASGINYFLTVHGYILKEASPNTFAPTRVASDPKITSIAYDDSAGDWYLLRDDGAVLKTTDITNTGSYTAVPGLILPTAQALAFGKGPTVAAVCP